MVDDNADMRLAAKLLLESEGYVVELAKNGGDALRIQRERPVQILVTDLFMPDVDGLETVQRFRAEYPDMPIIVISGGGSKLPAKADHLAVARELGVHTLRKPFPPQALLDALLTV
ncbi:MAG TPA: response regulator [Burkholderiales bacterium]|nr:response regulator [Burkholderiales bacterium]